MGRVFVQFGDDMRVEGEAEPVKLLIEDHIRSRIEAGSGAAISGASDEIYDHIIDLVAKFPWTGTISLPKREDPCGQSGETEGRPTYLFDQAAE